jgi:hypothetical protein
MKDDGWWTMAVIVVVVLFGVAQCRSENECEGKGGTYLWREAKCLDVRTIK